MFILLMDQMPMLTMRRKIILSTFLTSLLLFFGIKSFSQADLWKDSIILYSHMETLYPTFYLPSFVRGVTYAERQEWDRARTEYERSLMLHSHNEDAWSNLGAAYAQLHQTEKEIDAYRHALSLKPDFTAAQLNLVMALRDIGRIAEAQRELGAILQREPGNVMALSLAED